VRYERRLILALCVIAALRVFVFSAAFPFFNNVDEQAHVDLAIKYAHGYLPRGLDQFSAEPARYFALFAAISQCVVNWPAFASQYNFFDMWQ
jgi:hypothetical protein